ncbi:MAG TPA: DUF397 domain-containing protein [Streptosporangiaceae bacterium]
MDRSSLAWRKSRHSGAHGHCVEVAVTSERGLLVRDSKDPDGPVLALTPAQWRAFIAGLRGGAYGGTP